MSCLALAAFAFGETLGDGSGEAREKPSIASTLPPKLLAGERIVVGVEGASVSAGLRSAIRSGQVAAVDRVLALWAPLPR